MSEYIYVLEFSNNLIKVGKTKNIYQRIKTHVKNVSDTSGACLINKWYAQGAAEVGQYENELIAFCRERWRKRSREWFVDADYSQVVDFAASLPVSSERCDTMSRYNSVTLKLWVDICRSEFLDRMIKSVEDAEILQDWITDSGLDMSIFDVNDKLLGISPFVALFSVAIYQWGCIQVVESVCNLTEEGCGQESVDNEFNRVYSDLVKLFSEYH